MLRSYEKAQEHIPAYSDNATEHSPILERDQGEADDGDSRPQLLTGKQDWQQVLCHESVYASSEE